MLTTTDVSKRWAHYAVTGVRYAKPHHIELLRVRTVLNDGTLGAVDYFTRDAVVGAVLQGTVFKTIEEKYGGQFKIGARVETFTFHGTHYLKTVADGYPGDNLGSLPTF